MINGNSVIMQLGKESTYGTVATATKQLKISSESLKPVYNKIDEGLATGGRGSGLKATMGIGVEGSFSTLLRPDMVYLLAGVLGVETTPEQIESTDAYKHVFTAIESNPSSHLPAWTFYVDRKVGVFSYDGCKINSLSLSASAGDYLKCDASVVGRTEATATVSAITGQPSALKAFKFAQGKVYNGTYSTDDGFSGSAIADVDSIGIDINNNCDAQTQTTDTGDYYKEPEVGVREIGVSLEAIYDTANETIRSNLYKSDSTFAVKLEFISDEEADTDIPYKLTIILPCCQMSDSSANMGGLDTLKNSMSLNVVDSLSEELIIVEAVNKDSAKYI